MRPAATHLGDRRENELLASVARGDRRALEELYLAYHRRLARFLLRIAPRFEMAEEVINDTFWVVWQKAEAFRGASSVSTWIMGIAYRRALKALHRARVGLPSGAQQSYVKESSSEELARSAEERDWIARGLQQLPTEQRMAIELAYFLGHSCEEIAAIMDCPVSTVKARMFHARQKLRAQLPHLAGGAGS